MSTDDEDMLLMGNMMLQMVAVVSQITSRKRNREVDHRLLPREVKRRFRHQETHQAIQFDYLGPDPLFGKEFDLMFRMSRSRFQRLLEDFGSSNVPFYSGNSQGLFF